MKFLQIKNTPDGKPRVLEMGVDFDCIIGDLMVMSSAKYKSDYVPMFWDTIPQFQNRVGLISKCFQSRPLIEIGGITNFDVIIYESPDEYEEVIDIAYFSVDDNIFEDMQGSVTDYENIGSIFLPENQIKYPELYEKALEIVNNTYV